MKTSKRLYSYLSSLFIALVFFIFLLLAPIPYSLTAFFGAYSPALFFLVFILYILSFQLKGYWGWLAGLCVTMALFALTLSFMWASGSSNNQINCFFALSHW
ncbi:MAG: hypothetical protein B6I38_08315 [Anaerolineaceae bacterium 4572_5.1]|nr:MAG: hypothetical protein B6I38_08315 [Anaerolineaceae bacterium 4572_5.1]